jgi:hypothetical protein
LSVKYFWKCKFLVINATRLNVLVYNKRSVFCRYAFGGERVLYSRKGGLLNVDIQLFIFNYDFATRVCLPAHHNPDMYLGYNITWNFISGTKIWLLLFSITKRLQAFLISHIEIFSTYFKLHLHNQHLCCRHVKLTEFTRDTALVYASLVVKQKCFQYIKDPLRTACFISVSKLSGVEMLYEYTSYFSRYVVIPIRVQTVEHMAEFLLYLTYLTLIDRVLKHMFLHWYGINWMGLTCKFRNVFCDSKHNECVDVYILLPI